ncbi:unnamed protein product [Amoebophrya sp. A25]|nr:unnamed protein product [Amoebophrya sp. A25]|eukprot:GSA25T00016631001.1
MSLFARAPVGPSLGGGASSRRRLASGRSYSFTGLRSRGFSVVSSTLLLSLTLFFGHVAGAQSQDPDCVVDNQQAKCCEMLMAPGSTLPDGTPCLIANMIGNQGEVCSVACEKRYKSLGHECWSRHHLGAFWTTMRQLCDPQNNYEINGFFDPPSDPTQNQAGVNPASIGASLRRSDASALTLVFGALFLSIFYSRKSQR